MKMTKKQLLDDIKRASQEVYSEIILFFYRGQDVGSFEVPKKRKYETIKEYMEKYEVEPRGNGEYLFTVKIGYDGSLNILIDSYGGI